MSKLLNLNLALTWEPSRHYPERYIYGLNTEGDLTFEIEIKIEQVVSMEDMKILDEIYYELDGCTSYYRKLIKQYRFNSSFPSYNIVEMKFTSLEDAKSYCLKVLSCEK